jgi:hypothetical protein
MIKEPIFARTRYRYASYDDFWKLVELSGFKTCFVDQIDLAADEVYIHAPVNGETRPHIFHRRSILSGPQKARLVVFMLEKPYDPDSPGSVEAKVRALADDCLKFCEAVWISDRWIASLDLRWVYVELASHPAFASGPREPIQYDFAHMSCVTPRREGIYQHLAAQFRMAPNAWGDERDRILRSTRAMLNVHQDNTVCLEPLRVAIAAAYRLAYLTESSPDPYPLIPGQTCSQAGYDRLKPDVSAWLTQQDLRAMGEALYQRLCVTSNFRKGVMDALERTFK